jgi:glycosyltransferase involved in cell wall biosynthesis
MLYKLLAQLDPAEHDSTVVSLMSRGPIGERIQALRVPLITLGLLDHRVPNPWSLVRLAGLLRKNRPDVVQTWMYYGDLCGGLAARCAAGLPVIWNIRHSTYDPRIDKLRTRLTAKACAALSRFVPRRIVVNSEAGRQVHADVGYAAERMLVIPNCFDLERFQPSPAARHAIRQELRLDASSRLVGLVGRFHPMKGHEAFIRAMRGVSAEFPDAHFVLCGRDITWENAQLAAWIDAQGLRGRFHLLGERDDVPRILAACDLAVSASTTEGFANVIGEAMACEVPCVATDVGDAARILQGSGLVVPPGDADALTLGCARLLRMPPDQRRELGRAGRRLVSENYSVASVTARYVELWREVAAAHQPAPPAADVPREGPSPEIRKAA